MTRPERIKSNLTSTPFDPLTQPAPSPQRTAEPVPAELSKPAPTPTAKDSSSDSRPKIGRPKGSTTTAGWKKYTVSLNEEIWEECRDLLDFTKGDIPRTVRSFREINDIALMEYLLRQRDLLNNGEKFPRREGN